MKKQPDKENTNKWEDKFNTILENKFQSAPNKIWKFKVEENKDKGTMQLNVRQFTVALKEGGYEGPSKNGFILPLESADDVRNLAKSFNNFFDDVIKFLE